MSEIQEKVFSGTVNCCIELYAGDSNQMTVRREFFVS